MMDSHFYYLAIKRKCSFIIANYNIESQIHALVMEMFSHSFIDIHDWEEINKTAVSRDKMTLLILKLLKQNKRLDYRLVYDVLLAELRKDTHHSDLVEEIRNTLREVSLSAVVENNVVIRREVSERGTVLRSKRSQSDDLLASGRESAIRKAINSAKLQDNTGCNNKHRFLPPKPSCPPPISGRLAIETNQSVQPLILACEEGHVDVVRDLLASNSVDVNSVDTRGRTALMYAFANCDVEITKMLLTHTAVDINASDKQGLKAVWYIFTGACVTTSANDEISTSHYLKKLKSKVGDFRKRNSGRFRDRAVKKLVLSLDKATTLHVDLIRAAMLLADVDIVKTVQKLTRHTLNEGDFNALAECAFGSLDEAVVKLFLEHSGAYVRTTPELIYACMFVNDRSINKIVIEYIDPDEISAVLHVSLMAQTLGESMMAWKRMQKINFNTHDRHGNTPFMVLCQYANSELIEELLNLGEMNGIYINARNLHRQTAFMLACFNTSEDVAILLSHTGAFQANDCDVYDRSNLMYAAWSGHVALVSMLLKQFGIQVNAKDKSNMTALTLAIKYGRTRVAESLLKHAGVAINTRGTDGVTALMVASKFGRTSVVAALLGRRGDGVVDVNARSNGGLTALMFASVGGHAGVVRRLLRHADIDANASETGGKTPLMFACELGHREVVETLLEFGETDVNARNAQGETAFLLASKCGRTMVVEMMSTRVRDKC